MGSLTSSTLPHAFQGHGPRHSNNFKRPNCAMPVALDSIRISLSKYFNRGFVALWHASQHTGEKSGTPTCNHPNTIRHLFIQDIGWQRGSGYRRAASGSCGTFVGASRAVLSPRRLHRVGVRPPGERWMGGVTRSRGATLSPNRLAAQRGFAQ